MRFHIHSTSVKDGDMEKMQNGVKNNSRDVVEYTFPQILIILQLGFVRGGLSALWPRFQ